MASYSATVPSSWPPDVAFTYLASFETLPEWDPNSVSSTRLPGGPPELGVGARYEVVTKFAGREVTLIYEVTEFDAAARHITLVGENGSTTSIDTIDVADDGAVTYVAKLELTGLIKLIDPVMHLIFQRVGAHAKDGLQSKLSEPAPTRTSAG